MNKPEKQSTELPTGFVSVGAALAAALRALPHDKLEPVADLLDRTSADEIAA